MYGQYQFITHQPDSTVNFITLRALLGGFSFPGLSILKRFFTFCAFITSCHSPCKQANTTGVVLSSIQPYVRRFVVYVGPL